MTMYKLLLSTSKKSLYEFNTFTFTNAGSTGRTGPSLSQCRNSYKTSWAYDISLFNVAEGIQLWVVPKSGSYRIECAGAKGGGTHQYRGGNGARMRGDFILIQGGTLKILVGQMGEHSTQTNYGSGGGGGTFVTDLSNMPLIAAGGGGGAGRNGDYTHGHGGPAPITNTGTHSGEYGGSYKFGNGAGFVENGESAKSFINGGQGGLHPSYKCAGGFGGGGGNSGHLGGGGGGYHGGIGGSLGTQGKTNGVIPTGGGSFNIGSGQSNQAGANTSHGYVKITFLG